MDPKNDIELRNNKSHITLNIYNPKQLNYDSNKSESVFPITNSSVSNINTIFSQYPDNIRSVDDRKIIKTDYPMIEGHKNVLAKSVNFSPNNNNIREVPIIQQTPNLESNYEKNNNMDNYAINEINKKEDENKCKWSKKKTTIVVIIVVFLLIVLFPIIIVAT